MFDFSLTVEEMSFIEGLNKNWRYIVPMVTVNVVSVHTKEINKKKLKFVKYPLSVLSLLYLQQLVYPVLPKNKYMF